MLPQRISSPRAAAATWQALLWLFPTQAYWVRGIWGFIGFGGTTMEFKDAGSFEGLPRGV